MPDYMQEMPPELAAEQMRIARRRQLAEAMLAQSQRQQPIQHWTQGLAQLANAYYGKQGLDKADTATQALGQRAQAGQQDELAKVQAAMAPQPAITLPEGQAGPTRPEIPASQEKVRQALIQAQMSAYPQVRQFGAGQQKFIEADQARQDQAQSRLDMLNAQTQARMDQIVASAEQNRISKAEADARLAEMKRQHDQAMAQLKAGQGGGGGGEYGTFLPVVGPDGKVSYQFGVQKGPRSGQIIQPGAGGAPAQYDPKAQAALTEAKTGAKAQATRDFNMKDLGSVIGEAEKVLTGDVKPTSSGAGAAVDAAAALVGVSPAGAAQADKLRAIGGALTAKMPRMEGPQSDKDTALYREMAGKVGDATIPIERRMAALQQVKELWKKYDKGSAPSGGGGLSAQEQAELDALRKRFNRK